MKTHTPLLCILLWSQLLYSETKPIPVSSWTDHGLNAAQRNAIRSAFQAGIENKFIPGGSLTILHKGEIIFNEGFGFADLESQEPYTAEMPCRIASLTKPHTATMIALLEQQGKLSFSDPIGKYIPGFNKLKVREGGKPVSSPTLAQCLSHTAGFASNEQLKAGEFSLDFSGSLETVVNDLAAKELFYAPGTSYGYSRLGYMAAGRVAEIVTRKSFETAMDEVLFSLIGASESTFDHESVKDKIPTAYEKTRNGFKIRAGERDGDVVNPGGSLIATADGIARLLLLHRNHGKIDGKQVLSEAILNHMYVSQPGRGKALYGLGFNILQLRPDGTASRIQHTGASGTIGIIDFDLDLIVIVLTQVPQVQTNKWRAPLLKTVFDSFQ